MRKIERAFIPVACALVVFVAGVGLSAQEQAEPGETMAIQGELIEVDTENRVIVVRTAAETPMRFQFNDETEIAGAQESVAGLATARDAQVTVHYTEEGGVLTASKVEVADEAPSAPGV